MKELIDWLTGIRDEALLNRGKGTNTNPTTGTEAGSGTPGSTPGGTTPSSGSGHHNSSNNSRSGGGSGGGSSKYPDGTINSYVTYTEGTEGIWLANPATQSWNFQLSTGDLFTGNWANVRYYIDDIPRIYTFYFDAAGNMKSGWQQIGSQWYYLSETHDGFFGHRVTGWYLDQLTGHWYYMDPVGGYMDSGWQQIDGQWYYFTKQTDNLNRPSGSLLVNTVTPDGYYVDANGVWTRETP
jgi:hypothetical protein